MGNFYTNVSVISAPAVSASIAMQGLNRECFVLECGPNCVVYDKGADEQDTEILGALADHLSTKLATTAFAVMNHDDSILWFQLYRGGELLAEYANRGGPSTRVGALCQAFGVADKWLPVWFTLKRPYAFQLSRHDRLASLLGLPDASVGFGFNYIERGELPEEAKGDRLKHLHI